MFVNKLRMECLHSAEWPFAATTTAGMKQAQSWRCQMIMPREVFGSLLFVGVIFCFFFWPLIVQFYRWLKGSRKNYYLSINSSVNISSDNRRESIWPVIEINHGLFRRRSAIYGNAACNWYIKNAPNGLIYLYSLIPMRPDQALQIINTSLSVHDLYRDQSERIAKLEQEIGKLQEKIAWTESHRKTWLASLEALRQEIESDRQRYRSQSAQNIRIRVGQVLEHAKSLGQIPDDDSIDAIKRLWIVRDGGTPQFRKLGGQVWGY